MMTLAVDATRRRKIHYTFSANALHYRIIDLNALSFISFRVLKNLEESAQRGKKAVIDSNSMVAYHNDSGGYGTVQS
ncbi:hypothetical protein CVS40_6679 [Lucilia cuprina]|nr:hypothetical protein CVS40_6679 [Lucilia cuprina]